MKIKIWLFLMLLPCICFAQANKTSLIDSLKCIIDMPYIGEYVKGAGCGDKIYWGVVKQKMNIVPKLIDTLTDTTEVNIYVPNFGGKWTLADIAYSIISEIIKGIPTFELLGIEFDKYGCGYCSYWNHLRKDIRNRKKFQTAVGNWYEENKNNLVWIISNEFLTGDCWGEHPVGGHYEIKE